MSAAKLTTREAVDRAGVSRYALMRAKKAGGLWAERDNKGGLLWDAEALDAWRAQHQADSPQPGTGPSPDQAAAWARYQEAAERAARAEGERDGLREALTAERARAAAAEAEAARWREEATRRRRWWPW